MDSDRDTTIAQFLRWSHGTVSAAEELMDMVRSDADAADVRFDDAEIFQELVLGLDKFVSGIKEVYAKISAKEAEEEQAAPRAEDSTEEAA